MAGEFHTYKGPVMRKMLPFLDVIMYSANSLKYLIVLKPDFSKTAHQIEQCHAIEHLTDVCIKTKPHYRVAAVYGPRRAWKYIP